jgi:hypothetical protein
MKLWRVPVVLTKYVYVSTPSRDEVSDRANCMVLDALGDLDLEGNLLEDITLEVGEPHEE